MFLPIDKNEIEGEVDFVVISGDAYVDHPSFGHALIARLIESQGFSVAIVAQPQNDRDYTRFGQPRIGFMIASGVVDSMVNNYTAAKRRRSTDEYSEGGRAGKRPDRALTVYAKALRRLYPESAIIAGGVEASLRRLAHYDYWKDVVMPSIVFDAPVDMIVYGMGEKPILDLLKMAAKGIPLAKIRNVKGTAYLTDRESAHKDVLAALEGDKSKYLTLPSFKDVCLDKIKYIKAFNLATKNTDFFTAKPLIQQQSENQFYVQNAPSQPLSQEEMDFVYALPYMRAPHPSYKEKVPAIEEVEFSITAHRGCFGNCSFCALTYHQGRVIQNRSTDSIVEEAKLLAAKPAFKGYIHDVGGPSANFHEPACEKQKKCGVCTNRDCIGSEVCPNLKVDHSKYLDVLKKVRAVDGIKKVFIRSGIRFDYLLLDKNPQMFDEIVKNHTSGQLKVAPEHSSESVLKIMNKPSFKVYRKFRDDFTKKNKVFKLNQFLVPYFISSHPGCTLSDAVNLTEYLIEIGYMPKQVQDFYPTPSTKATTMYYTELDTDTLKPIYVAKTAQQKATQRALLQYRLKENKDLIIAALKQTKREDLIKYLPR